MELKTSSYLTEVEKNLPALLGLFDDDETSPTYGLGDRYHWAWNHIDFANGSFQGAANGLARLLAADMLPSHYSRDRILKRISAMFRGTKSICRRDGSLEEAYPFEKSFCITALVAYDLLTALEQLNGLIIQEEREDYLNVVRPLIRFLHQADETHAVISNHLAAAAAALYKWNMLTGEPGTERGGKILDKILEEQSDEGWYNEYGGADPGYQTLCTYYLADLQRMINSTDLQCSLGRSLVFLSYFAHPDGSFGGAYGSRNTRFLYPAGLEALSATIPEAAALAHFARRAISEMSVVTLSTMDPPNLVPMFNCYCWAATLHGSLCVAPDLPCEAGTTSRAVWPDAGIMVDSGPTHYTVIGLRKGGVLTHFRNSRLAIDDRGLIFQDRRDRLYSTQALVGAPMAASCEGDMVKVTAPIVRMTRRVPRPWQFLLLRILNLSIMRCSAVNELIKRTLVRILIVGRGKSHGTNIRKIFLGPELVVEDETTVKKGLSIMSNCQKFYAIYMASHGYWQKQDDVE